MSEKGSAKFLFLFFSSERVTSTTLYFTSNYFRFRCCCCLRIKFSVFLRRMCVIVCAGFSFHFMISLHWMCVPSFETKFNCAVDINISTYAKRMAPNNGRVTSLALAKRFESRDGFFVFDKLNCRIWPLGRGRMPNYCFCLCIVIHSHSIGEVNTLNNHNS